MAPGSGTEGYGETADALRKQYTALALIHVHLDILHLISRRSGRGAASRKP